MAEFVLSDAPTAYRAYGGVLEMFRCRDPEIILAGPFETGKTMGVLHKVNAALSKYPRARAVMCRLTYKSLLETAIPTYENKVLAFPPDDPRCPVRKYGGEKVQFYEYPNGSRLYVAGLDQPQKILSSEWDIIFVPQAEELSLETWQVLTARASGRAGNMPYAQVIGDANPGPETHWIKHRERITFIGTTHKDNPTIYERDANGELTGRLTERGKRSIEALSSLTGLLYKRGFLGLWVGAEGQVYEYDPEIHLIDPFPIPASWPRYRSIDFGFTNPFVMQWWALDEDQRLYLYRQIYMRQRIVTRHLTQINKLSHGEHYVENIADWDAEDRATLEQGIIIPSTSRVVEPGFKTIPADKRISVGIQAVERRLAIAGDGRPRIYFLRDSLVEVDKGLKEERKPTCTEEEFGVYSWQEEKDGKANKEEPIDEYNHGMDPMRYMVMHLDGPPDKDYKEAGAL